MSVFVGILVGLAAGAIYTAVAAWARRRVVRAVDVAGTLPLDELRDFGYLQEANRLFFHPHGLALAVRYDRTGRPVGLMVLDARDDSEGFVFDAVDERKAARVADEWVRRAAFRRDLVGGSTIQPVKR